MRALARPAFCVFDDCGKMLEGQRIRPRLAHVAQGGAEVLHRPFVILLLKPLDSPLQPKGAKIEQFADGVAAHGGSIA